MKKIALLLTLFASCLSSHAIVFVHLGRIIPKHIPYTLLQAGRFNPDSPIYLIGEGEALQTLPADCAAIRVPCESLPTTASHEYFKKNSPLNKGTAQGLWYYSTERFFYIEELMRARNLTDVFHLENDVLLYTALKPLLPIFQRHYSQTLGATFEADDRCVPGFLYIPEPEPLSRLNDFLATNDSSEVTDMIRIGLYRKSYPMNGIDFLPILPPEYVRDHAPLTSLMNAIAENSNGYSKHFEDFRSVFDAASFGIYLGGDDPAYHIVIPGRINPHCIFDPSRFQIAWETDSQNRRFPIAIYKGMKIKVNNLHMTNKSLIPEFVLGAT